MRNCVDPVGVAGVVCVGLAQDDVVEDEVVAFADAAFEHLLVEVVAHAVEQRVDGEWAVVPQKLCVQRIAPFGVVGEFLAGLFA